MGTTANRRDLLEGYRFLRTRALAAFLTGRLGAEDDNSSRINRALMAGVFLAIIALAAFGVLGIVRPTAAKGWDKNGSYVVERGNGARYVVLSGRLHPVLNTASARLLSGGSSTTEVDASALSDKARGLPVGIPGAPDELPDADRLIHGIWSACANQPATGSARTTLILGTSPGGTAVSDAKGVLVRGPDGVTYLASAGRRHRVASTKVEQALGWFSATPASVPASWLDVLTAGPDLRFPTITGRGTRSAVRLDGTRQPVGEVLSVQTMTGSTQVYVVLADGVAPIVATQALLLLGDPSTAALYKGRQPKAVEVTPAQLNQVLTSKSSLAISGLPASAPKLTSLPSKGFVCVVRDGDKQSISVAAGLPSDVANGAVGRPRETTAAADAVYVPESDGAVVVSNSPAGAVSVVTDSGQRYQLGGATAAVLKSLGYPGLTPVVLPASWVALLGDGPELSVTHARRLWTVLPTGDAAGSSQPLKSG